MLSIKTVAFIRMTNASCFLCINDYGKRIRFWYVRVICDKFYTTFLESKSQHCIYSLQFISQRTHSNEFSANYESSIYWLKNTSTAKVILFQVNFTTKWIKLYHSFELLAPIRTFKWSIVCSLPYTVQNCR